ncbi:3-mercaptopyruvate sulfurtransferase [Sulfuricella sp. T08]|uniref:sulfurtransferase n=1 Tax=Sulfuricella sp. T08 TaxID=1632857 RepID=UPI0006179D7D|nr:sulfurtransferase [Sulfuricella sp. T08]GAO36525.1 3-mercaptopyruvate sulfurtransferase [Sulfuricella sp. T08]
MKFTTLVSIEELAQHLDDPSWIVFDCRFTLTDPEAGRRAYLHGHIPGARYVHLDDDLSSPITPASGRHPLPSPQLLSEKLGLWGVDSTKQVVVYDDSFGSMAVRMWWLLRWLGHDAVALLNGGLPMWMRQKLPVTSDPSKILPSQFIPHLQSSMQADATEVDQARQDCNRVIIDARPEDRFNGEREPLDKVAGHIPGSINWNFEENIDFDSTYLPAEELREAYLNLLHGIPPQQVIHVCGSGVTACHNILAMEIAGLPSGKLYPGSWSEWITDSSRPIEVGPAGE